MIAGRCPPERAQAISRCEVQTPIVSFPREIDDWTTTRFFDTTAFQAQPVNTIGAQIVPRNLLHGPPQKRLDMSLFKDVPLQGSARLRLRMEVYKVRNTPSFGKSVSGAHIEDDGHVQSRPPWS